MPRKPREDGLLSDAEFHDLHVRLDKVRSTSKTVTVSREGLTNLLMDYSEICADRDRLLTILHAGLPIKKARTEYEKARGKK